MSCSTSKEQPKKQLSTEEVRKKKLEEALRNNLRRRKVFTRAQADESQDRN